MLDPIAGDIFRKGAVLNNTYEIDGVIGRGGTGEVYRARNQITGRVVAIKALNRAFSANADYLELLKREEAMRAINHDAVVRYTDCSRTEDGSVYLVMDYVDGVPLSDWLEHGGGRPRDLLLVALRVAEGLVATHAAKIVHRDLSPDNIVLRDGEPERATIIDFGIAKDTSGAARTVVGAGFAGKYEYAAPEQLDGRAEPRSDLYALGASLLATYRGRVPEVGASPGEILRHKAAPLDTAGVPEPLKSLIDDLTQPDPARRPPSAAAVATAIAEMLRPEAGERPRRRLAPLGLVLVAAAAAALLWLSGIAGRLAGPPVAVPYRLAASWDGAEARLAGHAPDADQRAAIVAAFAAVTGRASGEDALAIAGGEPAADWAGAIAGLLGATAGIDTWRVEVEGRAAALEGVARDAAARDAAAARFRAAAEAAGLAPTVRLAAGPRLLVPADLEALLAPHAGCGPLAVAGPEPIPLGGTVGVGGAVAGPDVAEAIRGTLAPAIGDRGLRLDLEVLNPPICQVRRLLPDVGPGPVSIRLGHGDRQEPNLTGIYRIGDNPTIEVLLPAEIGGHAWIALVDVGGDVLNLLPHQGRPEHRLPALGAVADGIRTIPVTYPEEERAADRMAITIGGSHGKSLVLVLVIARPLFPELRPSQESVEAFAEDLALALDDAMIESVAMRVIDTRP